MHHHCRAKRLREDPRIHIARGRVDRQRLRDHRIELAPNERVVLRRQRQPRRGLVIPDPPDRRDTRQQLVEHRAQRVDVLGDLGLCGAIGALASVPGRSVRVIAGAVLDRTGPTIHTVTRRAGKAGQHDTPRLIEEDVRRRQVAVREAVDVRCVQPRGGLNDDARRLANRRDAVARHPVAQ